MKRLTRKPEIFDVLELFTAIARKEGYSLEDQKGPEKFLQRMAESINQSRKKPVMLHGRRVQEMFAFLAASLGKCKIIKQEDSGEILALNPNIIPPDFRIVLEDDSEFFVEVKNYHKMPPYDTYTLRADYFDNIQSYAQNFNKELKFAIYWSKMNIWTLISADRFMQTNNSYSLPFAEAAKINEMASIGDFMVATTPPLSLKVSTDPSKPRRIDTEGRVLCTIGDLAFYCGGVEIEEPLEEHLAFYFMLFGDWPTEDPAAHIEDEELISFEYEAKPIEEIPGQRFEIIASLSQMISRQYTLFTAPEGAIEVLSPDIPPGSLGVTIPSDYKGKVLKLWRFVITPNYE